MQGVPRAPMKAPSPSPPLRPVLILALDGASFDVIDPMMKEGRLPHLAAWMKEGARQALPSTTPPVTFPAWSSFMTGLPPAEHGIFDFSQKTDPANTRSVSSTRRIARDVRCNPPSLKPGGEP